MTEMPDVDNRPVDWEAVERLADDSRRRDAAGLNRAAEAAIRALNLDRNGESIEPRHRMTVKQRDNVTALIDADKAVHADLEANYKDGPYQDGMYGTGMLLALGARGFVVVPQKDWSEARAAALREVAEKIGSERDKVVRAFAVEPLGTITEARQAGIIAAFEGALAILTEATADMASHVLGASE